MWVCVCARELLLLSGPYKIIDPIWRGISDYLLSTVTTEQDKNFEEYIMTLKRISMDGWAMYNKPPFHFVSVIHIWWRLYIPWKMSDIQKNATWRWQWAHLAICTCDMHNWTRYMWFVLQLDRHKGPFWPSYKLLTALLVEIWIIIQSEFFTHTDGQTGRKRRIGAHRANCTGGLKKSYWPFSHDRAEF